MGSLQNQNVVVVGGSRGVGRSIAEAALKERATVLAVARGKQALAQFAWEVSGVKTLAVDATVDSAPDKVFGALEPDVLVICAGALAPSAPVHEQNWKAFSANWDTDVKASFLFCRAALRRPLKPGSRIVLISSGAALTGGPPNAGGYAGAKRMQMFLAGHSQKEADRLGLGLRFMALAPPTPTPSFQTLPAASQVRKPVTRAARPSSSPSSPPSRICRPGSAPRCCLPTSSDGRLSRRRVCWEDRRLRSTARCSAPAQRWRRAILRDGRPADHGPAPKKACCSNATCRPGRPPISTA